MTGKYRARSPSWSSYPESEGKRPTWCLASAFGTPEGVVVDTHVQRISQRLGWTKHDEPIAIEQDLMTLFPERDWDMLSHTLIFHGRRICAARKPACSACPVTAECPSAFHAEQVGRKPAGSRKRGVNS